MKPSAAQHEGGDEAPPEASITVVLGVSGSGKTTVGRLLARRLGAAFLEGDDFHSPENKAKMKAGIPLQDADRRPWLAAVAKAIAEWRTENRSGVVSCSALKRRYRDQLRGADSDLRLIYLHGSPDLIARRLGARKGHFMPPSLLQSQFDALEEPAADERALRLDIQAPPGVLAEEAERWIRDCRPGQSSSPPP